MGPLRNSLFFRAELNRQLELDRAELDKGRKRLEDYNRLMEVKVGAACLPEYQFLSKCDAYLVLPGETVGCTERMQTRTKRAQSALSKLYGFHQLLDELCN